MVSAAEQLAANLNSRRSPRLRSSRSESGSRSAPLVYRFGTYIPLPGIDPSAWTRSSGRRPALLGMFNHVLPAAASTAWRSSADINALHLASIIIQLMTTVSPTLESSRRRRAGRKVMNQ